MLWHSRANPATAASLPGCRTGGATYPRDLFFDRSLNPYINRHPPLAAGRDPPALWTPILGLAMKGKERPAPPEAVILPPPQLLQNNRRFRR